MTKRRFHFKLEPIRHLRENAEQTVMKELAGELERAAVLRGELDVVEQRLVAARAPLAGAGSVTAAELAVRQAYVERMERELGEARHRTGVQDDRVEHTRARLAGAVRARRTLDLLEQRRRGVYDAEQRRVERVDADEISLTSHRGSGRAR